MTPPTDPTPADQTAPTPAARTLLDQGEIARSLTRMAHQIVELNRGAEGLVVLGIPTRGMPMAVRLAGQIGAIEGIEIPTGLLDITMYRDDLRRNPTRPVGHTHIPCPIDDKVVILADDVLYSGRTVLAALDALKDLGRPRRVVLAVLVDRGHRELPVQADVTGLTIGTAADEHVTVQLVEIDGADLVTIQRRPEKATSGKTAADEEGQK